MCSISPLKYLIALSLAAVATHMLSGNALAAPPPTTAAKPTWNVKSAADYLDKRNAWWLSSMGAIDSGTACIACHTAFPYALARPALRRALKESKPSDTETLLQASILKRVRRCDEMKPFLSGDLNRRERNRGEAEYMVCCIHPVTALLN